MENLILTVTIILFNIFGFQICNSQVSQDWVKRNHGVSNYYGTLSTSMAVDNFGYIYVAGSTGAYGIASGTDYILVKFNSQGDTLWKRTYNGSGNSNDFLNKITIDKSGNVYVTGSSAGASSYTEYATIKYDSSGAEQWVRIYTTGYHPNEATDIAVDINGNVYVTGNSQATIYSDYFTIKYNPEGDVLWTNRYSSSSSISVDFAKAIAIDKTGNVYVTGSDYSDITKTDITTIKYDSSGQQLWISSYDGGVNRADGPNSMAVDDSGNIYITGLSDHLYNDYTTIKYNANGNYVWIRNYNGTGNNNDVAHSVKVDHSGNVFVTGESFGYGTERDFATIKYNSNGDSLWVKRYNGFSNDYDAAKSLELDLQGNVYVTGASVGSGSGLDFVTLKYNSDGDASWVQGYNGTGNDADVAESIAIDNSGNIFVVGVSDDISERKDITTIKYSQSTSKTLQLTSLIEGLYDINANKMNNDTARVYLRNFTSPYAIVDSAKSFLDTNGSGTFSFSNVSNNTPYYIVVSHRNSIETWSSAGKSFVSNSMNYDFTTAAGKANGDNLILKGSRFCIYSGDVIRDGNINLYDIIAINNDFANFVTGYKPTDINGDSLSDLSDLIIAYNNSLNFVSVRRP